MHTPNCVLCRRFGDKDFISRHSPGYLAFVAFTLKAFRLGSDLPDTKRWIVNRLKFRDLKSFRDAFRFKNVILIYNDAQNQEPAAGRFAFWLAVALNQLTIREKNSHGAKVRRRANVLLLDQGTYTYASSYMDDIIEKSNGYTDSYRSKYKKISIKNLHRRMVKFLSNLGFRNFADLNSRELDLAFISSSNLYRGRYAFDGIGSRACPARIAPGLYYHDFWLHSYVRPNDESGNESSGLKGYLADIEKFSDQYDFVVFCKNGNPSLEVSTNDWILFTPIKFIYNGWYEDDRQSFTIQDELTKNRDYRSIDSRHITNQDLYSRPCFYERFLITRFSHLPTAEDVRNGLILPIENEFISPREIIPALEHTMQILRDFELIRPKQHDQFREFLSQFLAIQDGLKM